jgi:hypothetical protein
MQRSIAVLLLLALACTSRATETEHHGIAVLPAPGKLKLDGKLDDWDLSGGVFVCGDVEHLRDQFSVWVHAMYDEQFIYVLARWKDPTPLNNPGSSAGGFGFDGDCLQVRFITTPGTPEETITWWTCWRDRKGIGVVSRESPPERLGRLPQLANALENGAKQAFQVDADGKGYVQQIAVPWKLLSKEGRPLRAGDPLRMTVEPNFTAGQYGRITIKDIFHDNVPKPDRIFTFRAYDQWGLAGLEPKGGLLIRPVRLADGREFPVTLKDGVPVVDWTGLIRKFEWPGFRPISFTMPWDGYVSLNVFAQDGAVVRQLLTADFRTAGTHTVQWDGLTTPVYRTPGEAVPPGNYHWKAIAQPGVNLRFRGWACYGGSAPWDSGPTTTWGGDHGTPSACGTDGQRMYLAWNGAEGGRHLLGTDFQGNVLWGLKNTTGAYDPNVIAVDRGAVYVLHLFDTEVAPVISRVNAEDGAYSYWKGRKSPILRIAEVWDDPTAMPDHFDGLDARGGKLYATCSDPGVRPADIRDWKALVAWLRKDEPLARRIMANVQPATTRRLAEFLAGKMTQEVAFRTWAGGPFFDREVLRELNALLDAGDLAPNSGRTSAAARSLANRRFLEQSLAPILKPIKTGYFVVLDGERGKALRTWPLEFGGFVRAVSDRLVYVLVEGSSIVAIDPTSGATRTVVRGLTGAKCMALDAKGRLYASVGEPSQQVVIFTPEGKEAGRIGRPGGRAPLGPFQPDGMLSPFGLAVGPEGKLWVMEQDYHPKRVSVWDVTSGKLVKEFFGPCHYGASGGAINPRDPDLMVGEGCEWRIDPATGRHVCVGVFDRMLHQFACYREGANGRLYLFTATNEHGIASLRIFERLGDGRFALRVVLRSVNERFTRRPLKSVLWVDTNGNGREDPGEVEECEGWLNCTGSNCWSINVGLDMTLYALNLGSGRLESLRPAGFAACGTPRYSLAHRSELPEAFSKGYLPGYGCAIPDADGRKLLVNLSVEDHSRPHECRWCCFDLASGRQLWSYPNPWFQVHGSHAAPAPEPGLFRGAYGPIGIARLPVAGTCWVINGNVGEWHMLTGEGFYLSRLFQGDVFQWHWPEKAVPGVSLDQCPPGGGQEDFGGSMTQARDGKVYVQAGAHSLWNVEVLNVDRVAALAGGDVQLSEADCRKAAKFRDLAAQAAVGVRRTTVMRLTPSFTGRLDADFPGCNIVAYQKSDDAQVRSVAAWDATMLHLGWDVTDSSPWTNSAKDAAQMYASGDTVDFQLGTDPKADPKRSEAAAGDLRLSIGNFQGKPTAVLYRKVADVKRPRSFSSGVVAHYEMDYVDVVADANILVKVRPDKKGYVVEASVPLATLGLQGKPGRLFRGDFGATHGDPAAQRTQLRTYWNNQQTGLVADIVFELKMTPANWGELMFQ